jgi:hypothetical protein
MESEEIINHQSSSFIIHHSSFHIENETTNVVVFPVLNGLKQPGEGFETQDLNLF